VCGAELTVLGTRLGAFHPVCCNTDMQPLEAKMRFYHCPVCGAEIGVVGEPAADFHPVCCNEDMLLDAA
jgi:hypothetical protein